ncbi:hypothetical protein WA026_009383 [Henosepilachna vigintioctopunctata]|uniref:Uncharacterized protein n=1 Tax=Henosepilachna vigintioctopunctata TaxID=420089 RepID=A0AAW1U3S9_9CUCU
MTKHNGTARNFHPSSEDVHLVYTEIADHRFQFPSIMILCIVSNSTRIKAGTETRALDAVTGENRTCRRQNRLKPLFDDNPLRLPDTFTFANLPERKPNNLLWKCRDLDGDGIGTVVGLAWKVIGILFETVIEQECEHFDIELKVTSNYYEIS